MHHKKASNCPRKDRRLFTRDVDEFWGAGCGLGNLQPPLWAVMPQAVLPESCREPGDSSVSYRCHGVLGATPKLFSLWEHQCWQTCTVPQGKPGSKGSTTPRSELCWFSWAQTKPPSPTLAFSLCASISFPQEGLSSLSLGAGLALTLAGPPTSHSCC